MTEVLMVKKGEGLYSFEEVVQRFYDSDSLEEIRPFVENAEDRIAVTWASVDVVDKQNEKVDIADIIQQQEILLKRNGPITDNHTNYVCGQTHAYKVMEHPKTGTIGVLHLDRYFNDSPLDDQVWSETISGERQGASVGGYASNIEFRTDDEGRQYRHRSGFHQYETASATRPVNPFSTTEMFSLVAKAMHPDRESVINNSCSGKDISKEGLTMDQEVQKAFDSHNEKFSSIEKSIEKLGAQLEKLTKAEDEKEMPTPAEEEKDVEKSAVKKEAAASDIEGESGKDGGESPDVPDSNDQAVFKGMEEKLTKLEKSMASLMDSIKGQEAGIEKADAPRPASADKITKSEESKSYGNDALDIAMGTVKKSFNELNAELKEFQDAQAASGNRLL